MSCLDDNRCFDIGTRVEVSGVLENSFAVLATQIRKLCWNMLEINDCYNPPLMSIQLRGNQGYEAPPFMAGSSHGQEILDFMIKVSFQNPQNLKQLYLLSHDLLHG